MEIVMQYLPQWAIDYYKLITPQQWLYARYTGSIALMLVGLATTIYAAFRARGWRRYHGTWYSPQQFEAIVQELYSGVRDGRVPDYETMKLLDEYVYGPNGSKIRDLNRTDRI